MTNNPQLITNNPQRKSLRLRLLSIFSFRLNVNPRRGFTLIETFVAITILVTAVVGPLTLASRGLTSAMVAKDQLTASFLAQEGIEYVRQVRDSNNLQDASWLSGLEACIDEECLIDSPAATDPVSCGGECVPLRFDETTGFYTYDLADTQTQYTRSVRVELLESGYEAKVTSTVSWYTGIFNRQIVLTETLTNWQ